MTNAVPDEGQTALSKKHSVDYTKKFTFTQYLLLVNDHQLTEVLQKLESSGIGDELLKIFVIANLQISEVLE